MFFVLLRCSITSITDNPHIFFCNIDKLRVIHVENRNVVTVDYIVVNDGGDSNLSRYDVFSKRGGCRALFSNTEILHLNKG